MGGARGMGGGVEMGKEEGVEMERRGVREEQVEIGRGGGDGGTALN